MNRLPKEGEAQHQGTMPEGVYNLVALNLADINWLVPARKTLSVKKTGVQYRRYTDDVELIHSDLGALRNTIC